MTLILRFRKFVMNLVALFQNVLSTPVLPANAVLLQPGDVVVTAAQQQQIQDALKAAGRGPDGLPLPVTA